MRTRKGGSLLGPRGTLWYLRLLCAPATRRPPFAAGYGRPAARASLPGCAAPRRAMLCCTAMCRAAAAFPICSREQLCSTCPLRCPWAGACWGLMRGTCRACCSARRAPGTRAAQQAQQGVVFRARRVGSGLRLVGCGSGPQLSAAGSASAARGPGPARVYEACNSWQPLQLPQVATV